MVGNPNHDGKGRFSSGRGGYGPGQTLKGKYAEPSKTFSSNKKINKENPPNAPAYEGKRFGRMNSTERAKLTASAQFNTKTKPGKVGKLPTLGATSPRMMPAGFGEPFVPHGHAVALQTAKSLNKDFHAARAKSVQDSQHAALAKANVPITKLPAGPKPKYGPKGKMK